MKTKDWIKDNWFKVVAAVILFVGIGKNPYGYYEFLHWAVSASAFYAAYRSHHAKHSFWVFIFSIIGVLFNPIIPFYLAQSTWQRWDLLAGAIFIIGAIFEKTPVKDNSNAKENFLDLGIIEQKEQKSTTISSETTEATHQMKNVTAQNLGKAFQIIGVPEAMAAQKSGTYEEFKKRFESMDDEHLIATFNGDVGKPGWTNSRASFCSAMAKEFERRHYDYSAIGKKDVSLSWAKKIKLVDKKIVIEEPPLMARHLISIISTAGKTPAQIATEAKSAYQKYQTTYQKSLAAVTTTAKKLQSTSGNVIDLRSKTLPVHPIVSQSSNKTIHSPNSSMGKKLIVNK